jgi:glycosyltransferase involved in cell wall biosynthesis
MSNVALVSVIIIFLNAERFIEEAIESVFAQLYDQWELLLVDDGSNDGSTTMARRRAEKYPERIRYLEHTNHQNRGMSASRNLGIRHARGEFIAFLDADDVWLAEKLKRQVAILKAHPEAGMVYGSTQLWHSWTGEPKDGSRDTLQPIGVQPNTIVNPPNLLARYLSKRAITPAPSDVLLRRETVDAVSGFEESFRGMYEDQVFFAKVCLKTPVFVSGECWDRHRQHPNSACSVWRGTGEYYSAEVALMFLNWMEDHLSEHNMRGTETWKILQRALLPYRHPNVYRTVTTAQNSLEQLLVLAKQIARHILPLSTRDWLRARFHGE